MTMRDSEFFEALDDLVTVSVRRLRDAGVTHDEAMDEIAGDLERALGLLVSYQADNAGPNLEVQLLKANANVGAAARLALRKRAANHT